MLEMPTHRVLPFTIPAPASMVLPSARWLFAATLLGCVGAGNAAGYVTLTVPPSNEGPELRVAVWTPCATAGGTLALGPHIVAAVADCALDGDELPLVVISHGQGGTLLSHHDTATALADAGYVVASINHPGDTYGDDANTSTLAIFESRPSDVSRTISYMLETWDGRARIDPASIGVFGFSRGGYTALALAGARPSITASAARLCGHWLSFTDRLCRRLGDDVARVLPRGDARVLPRGDARVRAAVVVDPLNLFDEAGLRGVQVPVQLWASALGGAGVTLADVEAVRAALPPTTEFRVAQGAGHFAFLAPCPPGLRASAPEICDDPDGFDRVTWHRTMNAEVVAFFDRTLPER
jgi:predicted dienelactone hydrolase